MKKKQRRKPSDELPAESQAADALTIAWMLAVMTTLICQIGALALRWIALANPALVALNNFSGFLFFAAMIIGIVALALIPMIYKLRIVPPPRGIIAFAIVVSIAPWITLLVQ